MRHSRQDIGRELRRRIVEGVYPPGSRLPLRRELLRELGASPLTLQRAMDRLAEQRFIEARGTQGTYVAARLPNRGTIAVVFPSEPEHGVWNRFWSIILKTAETWDSADGFSFRPYYLAEQNLDVPEHRRLCADLADGGLAGMLLVSSPHNLVGSPILTRDCPRVCIGSGKLDAAERYRATWMAAVDCGVHEAVVRRLADAGRRRVAIISHPGSDSERWLPLLKAAGLATRPEWWIGIPPNAASCAQGVARLLCSWPDAQRPDALLITDDNLVPHATAGVLDAGLQSPRDIAVAAHANFPGPTHASFPCLRFGVDVRALLQACIEELVRLEGGARPRVREVPRVLRDA
jgi:DNA-binding LacI/PurR family transcriptional regulator